MSTTVQASPITARERIASIDVLRGFALLGIMFVNMTWFTGFAVLGPDERTALGTGQIDAVTAWLVHFAVDGKFWSLFALLFGVGFGLLAERADRRGEPPGHRRDQAAHPRVEGRARDQRGAAGGRGVLPRPAAAGVSQHPRGERQRLAPRR